MEENTVQYPICCDVSFAEINSVFRFPMIRSRLTRKIRCRNIIIAAVETVTSMSKM